MVLSAVSSVAVAETVPQTQAKKIASQFFNAANGRYMAEPKFVYNGRRLTTQRLFTPFYVYNNPAGGFVIISAENKAFPILAYSLKDTFDPNHIGDKLQAILRGYALDIERIRYDERVPYDAIEAWTDIPHYIDNLLSAPYYGDDVIITVDEGAEMVDRVFADERYDDNWSDIYTPSQWGELIDTELDKNRNVALGIIGSKTITPVIVQSRRGDYYRIRTDVPDMTMYRLFATEYLSDGQLAMLDYAPGLPEQPMADTAFRFYDDFITETRSAHQAERRDIEEALTVTDPVIHAHGSGFYTVDIPEEAAVARIYNLGGAMVRQYTYGSTMSPHFDLLAEPTGFYFAQIIGKSGRSYGVKIVR